jgi:NADH-quinone oxidoreductase subunit H
VVGGYQVEYSGFRFLFFFMGEFGTAFAFAAIASVLFLGGWYVPGFDVDSNWLNWIGPGVMLAKVLFVSFLIFWVRFTYPRLREDQLQAFAWKYLIPISLANIAATSVLKVVF